MRKHSLSFLALTTIALACASGPVALGQVGFCPVTSQVPTGNPVATLLFDASINECYASYGDQSYPCCPAAASIDLPAGSYIVTLNGDVWSTEGYGGPAALPFAWGSGSCPSHSSANSCILIDPRDPRGGPLLIDHPGGRVYAWRNDNYWGDNYGLVTINFYAVGNQPPDAYDDSYTTDQDTHVDITLFATDPDNDPLTYSVDTAPAHGTLTGTPPNLTYAPAQGYSGPDSFTFKANDGHDDSNIATVSITVGLLDEPTNLRVTPVTSTAFKLEWDYRSGSIDGFAIERKAAGGSIWEVLSYHPDAFQRMHMDSVPNAYGTYSYRIRAYRGGTFSSYSDESTGYEISTLIEDGIRMRAFFTPNPSEPSLSLLQIASTLGFDHFNWISIINHLPTCYINAPTLHYQDGNPVLPPSIDPPAGGYIEYRTQPDLPPYFDRLPYYWDEEATYLNQPLSPDYKIFGYFAKNQATEPTAEFRDLPSIGCVDNPPGFFGAFTMLVGVNTPVGADPTVTPAKYRPLTAFNWYTTYNYTGSGGVGYGRPINLGTPTPSGAGGIFGVQIVKIEDLPVGIRRLLIQTGAEGVTDAPKIDTDPPTTIAFSSDLTGSGGWYTKNPIITLIATDIDGPGDVNATYYLLDEGAKENYSTPFSISGDEIHTLTWWSEDKAGNVESRKSMAFQVDTTAPVITAFADRRVLWPPNGKMVPVTISGTIADSLSGVDSAAASFSVIDDYGQVQPEGSVTLVPRFNGSYGYSFTVQLNAQRNGPDPKGRNYNVTVAAMDNAGNKNSATIVLNVPRDSSAPGN